MRNKKVFTFLAISLILFFAASLRIHTFYLPHRCTDQLIYTGLAMKLEKFGLKGYNLKGIDIARSKDGNFLAAVSSSKEKGSLLGSLEQRGILFYSKGPLSHMAPAFSYLLMISHKIFSPNKLYSLVNKNLGPWAIVLRPEIFLKTQFYAVWISFAFSLLLILMVFLLGRLFFNEKIGLWASLLMAAAPLDIFTSQRVHQDEMVAFFSALCVLLFWYGRKKNSLSMAVLSGISAGVAALTKGSGLFIIAAIFFSFVLVEIRYASSKRNFFHILFDKYLIIFILAAVSVCGFWYAKITFIYGAPWYVPCQPGIEKLDGYFAMLSQRSRFGQLYYFVYLSPLFIFVYWESIKTLFEKMFTKERIILVVWFFLFAALLIVIQAREERYMLPAYPPIAILSSITLENIRIKLNRLNKLKHFGNIMIILIFSLTSAWSIKLGLTCVFKNHAIFTVFN
ncbi:MAG: glycosyltransferase family 39 protein [Candidatus Omnitrophota bacterium]